jgi:ABC-type transporter Mla subunit MlaD
MLELDHLFTGQYWSGCIWEAFFMSKERNDLKAGIFILISVGLIVTVILSIKGIGRIFTPDQQRTVSFRLTDDLNGLQVGDEVRLGGYKLGVVKDIEVRRDVREAPTRLPATTRPVIGPTTAPAVHDDGDATRLVVTFTLPARYTLSDDAVIGVQAGVTGTACLNISSLGSGKPPTQELSLVGKPAALNSLLTNLGDLAPDLPLVVADARGAIADTRGTIGDVRSKVVPELGETLARYKGAGAHLEDVLGDTKGDIRGTMANLKDVTGTVKEKLPDTMDAAKRFIVRLDDTVKNTQGTLDDVKKSVANVRVISEKAREIIGGNKGKLDTMIASLKTTGENLKAASTEIRHSPWRLLYKPGKGEMANLNLYDSARQFAEGAGSLNDAALALRDALENKDVKPEEVKELLQKLDGSFANFRQVEDKLWTLVQE